MSSFTFADASEMAMHGLRSRLEDERLDDETFGARCRRSFGGQLGALDTDRTSNDHAVQLELRVPAHRRSTSPSTRAPVQRTARPRHFTLRVDHRAARRLVGAQPCQFGVDQAQIPLIVLVARSINP